MSFSGSLLETLFENLVTQNRLEQGMDHLGHQPDLGHIFESLHAYVDPLLTCRHNGGDRGPHLIYMHDQCREQTVNTVREKISRVQQGSR